MFLLTRKGHLINADRLVRISRLLNDVFGVMEGGAVCLIYRFDTEEECERAYRALIRSLADKKELYTFDKTDS